MVCRVLNGVIAQGAGDWEEVCGRNNVSGARLHGMQPLALFVTVGSHDHSPSPESSCQVQEAFSRSYLTSKLSLLRRKQDQIYVDALLNVSNTPSQPSRTF